MTARPSFGLLVDWLQDEYQNQVLAGVEDAARKLGVHLRVFAGGVLDSPKRKGKQRNFIYDLVGPENVQGLVVMGGAIGNYVGAAELARFCERFRPLPMCSVGIELAGMPSILVDNQRGMRNLLVHLIQVHGYRRLAFIRGPRVNSEAERRFEVYRQILGEYGISFDPELVVDGDFQPAAGAAAIRELIDQRNSSFDVVVAAADPMALGAIDALSARGVRVPYDVAVVGFDDIEAARFATSPLSTVRQPLREQGVYAMQTVLAQSRGELVEERVVLRTQFIVRESCGCPPQTGLALGQYDRTPSTDDLPTTLQKRREQIVGDMARAMRARSATLEVGWGERLLEALGAELRAEPEGVFISTFHEILTTVAALGGKVNPWQGVVSILRHHAQACAATDAEGVAQAEELWHQARVCVGNVAERAQAQQRLQAVRWQHTLRTAEEALSQAVQNGSLSQVLSVELSRLKIPSCAVSLFERDEPADRVCLTALHSLDALPAEVAVGDRFPVKLLAPPGLLDHPQRTTHVVQPLFSDGGPLGFAFLQLGSNDGVLTEFVRERINAAFNNTLRLRQAVAAASHQQQALPDAAAQQLGIVAQVHAALLPSQTDIPALRVSAATLPGAELGGDYYEVLPFADGCWLAVGEVEGQGPHAGLVMLMLQSAVATACAHSPNAAPSELLCSINAVMFENVSHRLGVDRPAALTLLRCSGDGRLVYAGAHQQLIICRASDGACSRLATPGTKVGAVSDISRVTVDTHCQLQEKDLLILHTDGALEATNDEGEPFGVERLCRQLEALHREPVDRIRGRLLDRIHEFAPVHRDDITILVARYGLDEQTLAIDK